MKLAVRPPITGPIRSPFGLYGIGLPLFGSSNELLQYLDSQPTVNGVYADSRPGVGSRRAMQPGRAYQFDGVDDLVDTNYSFSLTESFSLSAWIYQDDRDTHAVIWGDAGVGAKFNLRSAQTSGLLWFTTDGVKDYPSTYTIPLATWVHVAVVMDSAYDVHFYINGAFRETVTHTAGAQAGTQNLYIGNSGSAAREWTGEICHAAYYAGEWSAAEIADLYSGDVTSVPLTLYYKCDDTHDTIAYDSSGNGTHGTKTGITTSAFHYTGADVPYSFQNQVGFSSVGTFDGTDDYVRNASFTADAYAFSFWFKPDAEINTATSITPGVGFASTAQGDYLAFGASTGLILNEVITVSKGTNKRTVVQSITISPQWHHLLCNWNGTEYEIWLDGVEQTTAATSGGHADLFNANTEVIFGSYVPQTLWFDGCMKDCRVWNAALTSAEIATVYAGGTTGSETLHWKLDEGTGLVATDSGSGGYTGTIGGATAAEFWQSVPRDESSTANDIRGVALDYSGKAPTDALITDSNSGSFDGVGYVDAVGSVSDYSFIQNTKIFSIAFWTRLTSATTRYAISGNNNASTGTKGHFLIHEYGVGFGTNAIRLSVTNAAVGNPVIDARTADSAITDTNWHHVAVVCNGTHTDVKWYIDGALSATTYETQTGTVSAGDSQDSIEVGKVSGWASSLLNGGLCDYRIYNDALTADEVSYLYDSSTGTDPGATNLKLHLPLSEGSGIIAHDVSGEANPGTVTSISEATFWGTKQDKYHHNISNGFSPRMNKFRSTADDSVWTKNAVTLTDGTSDPFGTSHAMRIIPSTTSLEIHRAYSTSNLATATDYIVIYAKKYGNAHPYFGFMFSGGGYATFHCDTPETLAASSSSLLYSGELLANGWAKVILKSTAIGTNVVQIGALGSATNPGASWTPTNTTDGVDVFFGCIENPHSQFVYPHSTAYPPPYLGVTRVPKLTSTTDATGLALERPAGKWHNGAESLIDFTGDVTFPGSSTWQTAWAYHAPRTNPSFNREVVDGIEVVKADRFLTYESAVSATNIDNVWAFVGGKTYDQLIADANLLARYIFDGDGTDETGTYNLTVNGTPGYSAHGLAGIPGQMADCTNTNNFTGSGTMMTGSTAWTLCGWVKADVIQDKMSPWWGSAGSGSHPVIRYLHASTEWEYYAHNGTGWIVNAMDTAGSPPVAATWQHIAIVYDGHRAFLYIDGINLGTGGSVITQGALSANDSTYLPSVARTRVGASTNYLDGKVADFNIFNRALTNNEILAMKTGT